MAYSSLFSVIHDEKQPVGHIGQGTHYSVFSCAQWVDHFGLPHDSNGAQIQKFAVIWDEDHDERVIAIIERAYIQGLISPVKFIGERKGSLTVIVNSHFWECCGNKREYIMAWERLTGTVNDDSWGCEVRSEDEVIDSTIIHPRGEKVVVYLKNIDNLWGLGIAPFKPFKIPKVKRPVTNDHAGENGCSIPHESSGWG